MRSRNIEILHIGLRKHILLVKGYTEIKEIEFIIKACRLKPEYTRYKSSNKLELYRWWIDEYGNSLKVLSNKKVEIRYNDLELDRSKIVSTDLYYGLSISKVVLMSKLAYIYIAEREGERWHMISLYGIDNYLRTYIYDEGWKQVSSLCLGLKNLKRMNNNKDIQRMISFNIRDETYIKNGGGRGYIIGLPIKDGIYEEFSRDNGEMYYFLRSRV